MTLAPASSAKSVEHTITALKSASAKDTRRQTSRATSRSTDPTLLAFLSTVTLQLLSNSFIRSISSNQPHRFKPQDLPSISLHHHLRITQAAARRKITCLWEAAVQQ
jgi:hypothetical protein